MGKEYAKIFFGVVIYLIMIIIVFSSEYPNLLNINGSFTTDESSLLAIKAHIHSDILAKNWSQGTNVCTWIGISWGQRHPNRVTGMNLSNMALEGTIPGEIGNLSFLSFLDISNNSISSTIPDEIGKLRRLRMVDMQSNHLTGHVPQTLGRLQKLVYLRLSENRLNGDIPTGLTACTELRVLDLSYNNLTGSIPVEIGNLSHLQMLFIGANQLTGKLPSTLFNISSLKTLDAVNNEISGTLPRDICSKHAMSKLEKIAIGENHIGGEIPQTLEHCGSLRYVSLQNNKLIGYIPIEPFWNLSSLQVLYLDRNEFSGTIPQSIVNLSKLTILDLGQNTLHGSIPSRTGLLSGLTWLSLGQNQLSGEIPKSMFNLSSLFMLQLTFNNLSGNIPSSIDKGLPNVQRLLIGANYLSGSVPDSISNLSEVRYLDVGQNMLTGLIPVNLGDMERLQFLDLDGNYFRNDMSNHEQDFFTSLTKCTDLRLITFATNPITGELPKSIGSGNHSTVLETLLAYSCRFTGTIPNNIGTLANLVWLDLSDNDLTGVIPTTMGDLKSLQKLQIGGNKFQGLISNNSALCKLENLYFLNLSSNQFSGKLPSCLGNLDSLEEIYLDNNSFSSNIPSTLWLIDKMRIVSFSINFLNGTLSQDIANAKSLTELYLSRNDLSDHIPTNIGRLESLSKITLSHNRLNGSIPESLASLKELQYVDLSYNNLLGEIPKSLEKLQYLKYFNVSFNDLSGEIPNGGQFANFSAEFFKGNKGLCGASHFNVHACRRNIHKPSRKTRIFLKFILPPIASILVIVIVFLGIRVRKPSYASPPISIPRLGVLPERISYNEILRATRNFDEANLIGRGSIGSVYKGTISDQELIVAVKIFNLDIQGAFKSFETECEVMRNIRHRNLVKIITSSSNLDFKALVLEYMPNGNLDTLIHSQKECFLNLGQRLGIMMDVASAIEYLHLGYSSPIVHCDLKPSNILLDEDMVAHVGDFGISKLLTEEQRISHTKTLGTLGYMAPEYGATGIVSTMVDVYSFGILLMETFTRKKPTDEMFSEEFTLKRWVSESLHNAVMQIADVRLLGEDNGTRQEQCLVSIFELALVCSSNAAEDRPSMREVSTKLKKTNVELSRMISTRT